MSPKVLYVVRVIPDGPVKIGTTAAVEERVTKIQWGCPWRVSLCCVIGGRDLREIVSGTAWEQEARLSKRWATAAESALHDQFRATRMEGEWFASSPALEAFIDHYARAPEARQSHTRRSRNGSGALPEGSISRPASVEATIGEEGIGEERNG